MAWRAHPHPDLADVYLNLRQGDSSRQKLDRMRKLAQETPGSSPEGALALARAAIAAQDFALARSSLAPLISAPTQRVATLMAELEEKEHSDIGRAREWMARALTAARDPAWTADGFVSERWMPVSPSGRLDAFEWKVPIAELPGPVIEPRPRDEAPPLAPPPPAPEAAKQPEPIKPAEPVKPAPPVVEPPPPAAKAEPAHSGEPIAASGAEHGSDAASSAEPQPTPVTLMHAPDDPGPGSSPATESEDTKPEPKQEGWWRTLFG
jgi:HemY protein